MIPPSSALVINAFPIDAPDVCPYGADAGEDGDREAPLRRGKELGRDPSRPSPILTTQ
jgi:hypothetical protein